MAGMVESLEKFPTSGQRVYNSSSERCIFRPENWVSLCRTLQHSSRKTGLQAGWYYHLPVGRFDTSSLRELLNFQLENAILLKKYSTTGWRFEIYPAEAQTFAVRRLSSTEAGSIISRADDSILSPGRNSQLLLWGCHSLGENVSFQAEDWF